MITPYESIVVRVAAKVLVPFVQVFALYVIVHGHESPGGGFQGGTILGASIILTRFTVERRLSFRYTPGPAALRLGAIGVLLYAAVGFAPLLWGGAFLDYDDVPIPGLLAAQLRALGILAVEASVALAVTGVMVSIFDDLAPDPPADEGES
jgi:multicomponent Na+:H+ antiporter subunit B